MLGKTGFIISKLVALALISVFIVLLSACTTAPFMGVDSLQGLEKGIEEN